MSVQFDQLNPNPNPNHEVCMSLFDQLNPNPNPNHEVYICHYLSTMPCWNAVPHWIRCCCNSGRMRSLWTLTITHASKVPLYKFTALKWWILQKWSKYFFLNKIIIHTTTASIILLCSMLHHSHYENAVVIITENYRKLPKTNPNPNPNSKALTLNRIKPIA